MQEQQTECIGTYFPIRTKQWKAVEFRPSDGAFKCESTCLVSRVIGNLTPHVGLGLESPQRELRASAYFCRTAQALLLQTLQTNPGNVLLDIDIHLRFHQRVLWLGGIPREWTFYRSDEF